MDLAAGDTWTRDVGDIADGITPEAGIRAVTVVIQPSPSTLRICYKANVDLLEIPSSTGSFAYEIPVPEGDEEAWFEYVIEARDETSATRIARSGYIRIKKLNSGG